MKCFSPEYQEAFWSQLDPDLRAFLDNWEEQESWTYDPQELPELYSKLQATLPKLAQLAPSPRQTDIIRDLIPLLTAMPLRMSVSALSWLDQRSQKDTHGWGVFCLMEASRIAEDPNDDLQAEAKAFASRIRVMLQTSLAAKLFSRPEPLTVML